MRSIWTRAGSLLVLAAASVVVLGAGRAERVVRISGSAELTYAKQEAVPVSGKEGHLFVLGETRGTNRNTGSGDYFGGAEVVNAEMADLDQGNGIHHGYYAMTKDAATVVAKWEGKVTTAMVENQPRTTFKGTWRYVHGTGRYAGIQGKGTYEGEFLAKDRYAVRWEGSYQP